MSHTKGPWTVSEIGLIEAGKKVIGDVCTGLDSGIDRVGSKAEQKANGRLIAAAPEMLAALKITKIHIRHACDCAFVTGGINGKCSCGAANAAEQVKKIIRLATHATEYGHCDTCGAKCDCDGCTADRSHQIAIISSTTSVKPD